LTRADTAARFYPYETIKHFSGRVKAGAEEKPVTGSFSAFRFILDFLPIIF
jgi:hypothetical protein